MYTVAVGKILYQSALSQLVTEVYTAERKTFTNWWKIRFSRENFCRLLAIVRQTKHPPPNFAEKTFTKSHKTLEIHKSFLPRKFPAGRYCFLYMHIIILSHLLYSESILEWATVVSTVEVEELP